jgi:hypothetical protein
LFKGSLGCQSQDSSLIIIVVVTVTTEGIEFEEFVFVTGGATFEYHLKLVPLAQMVIEPNAIEAWECFRKLKYARYSICCIVASRALKAAAKLPIRVDEKAFAANQIPLSTLSCAWSEPLLKPLEIYPVVARESD